MRHAHNQPEYTVSEIAAGIKRTIEDTFGVVRVRGEISKVNFNKSGHVYFSLKDDAALLDAVSFKGMVSKLAQKPEEGLEVIATGRLTIYAGSSKYQLVVEALEAAGVGALMAMLEARKKQLAAEGLFDTAHKKPLPYLPQTIGVITSPTGAVIRDILHRVRERFPCRVLLWPVAVQGQGAAEQIAAAIEGFHSLPAHIPTPDILIVARGGGSFEDLMAFNEEILVRAVAAATIPIISAVGHETDTTLIDFAADKRAPTPTGAAEMAVPVRLELLQQVGSLRLRLHQAAAARLQQQSERLSYATRGLLALPRLVEAATQKHDDWSERLSLSLPRLLQAKHDAWQSAALRLSPVHLRAAIEAQHHRVQPLVLRLQHAMLQQHQHYAQRLKVLAAQLPLLDVSHTLARGFALVKNAEGMVVTSAHALPASGTAQLQFHDGTRDISLGSGGNGGSKKRSAASPVQESLF